MGATAMVSATLTPLPTATTATTASAPPTPMPSPTTPTATPAPTAMPAGDTAASTATTDKQRRQAKACLTDFICSDVTKEPSSIQSLNVMNRPQLPKENTDVLSDEV